MRASFIIYIIITLLTFSCGKKKISVDTLIINATIYTVDSTFSTCHAIAIRKGKIVEAGETEALKGKYEPKRVIDYSGKFIYPGFIDAHCHFYGYAVVNQRYADLNKTKSAEEIIDIMKKFDAERNDEFVLGRGWDQNNWESKNFPDKKLLDEAFGQKPVILIRTDGHAVWVNSKVLEMAGFTINTKITGGQLIVKDGQLTGVLIDNAADSVKNLISAMTGKSLEEAILKAQENCFAVGLTSVVDAGLESYKIEELLKLQKVKKLKMRINAMLAFNQENMDKYVSKGRFKTDRLHICSMKFYADGALGSRGACLLEPNSDSPTNKGTIVTNDSTLYKAYQQLYDAGFQVNTHAIGDSAVRTVLRLYSKILKTKNDERWRIEHSQVVNPSDFHLFGEYSVIPAINTTHATSDMGWATDRLGNQRINGAYAYKQLLQQNGWLTNGSDFPIESINPLLGFYAAVSRVDVNGKPEGGFMIKNALTREEAIKAMTIWAAKGSFEDKEKGSLEPGKYADFVVMEMDLMNCNISEIPGAQVIETWSNGELVFKIK